MKNNEKKRSKAPIIGDMIFSLLTLPSAMGYIQEYFTNPESPDLLLYLSSTFVVMGIARLFRAFRYRRESRLQFVKFLIYGFLMLACSFSGLVFDKTTATRIFVVVYLGSLIVDRVISLYMNHGLRNVILNLIAVFMLGWTMVEMYNELDIVFIMMIIVVLHALVSILSVSFARINLKSLSNVARETYAAEIIGGLLLLIFAFSYILRFLEPNMESLKDGLWYCFAIVTTIGFGDITATTAIGRILSVILGMYGIVVVALITSVIVNYYGEMRREKEEEGK
jgi:hypothetical protein